MAQGLRLRLPATSANLGPGFDALGLAMTMHLTVEAHVATEFAIVAAGRDAALCGDVANSLIFSTYRSVAGQRAPALALQLHNEIPLGKGCGSSAAALLAGVLLANHFGGLGWTPGQVLDEACRREGHPDNVATCWAGGLTCSVDRLSRVFTATLGVDLGWRLMVVIPSASLSTAKARTFLPSSYSREDAVANVQRTALLVAAFALGRGDLLREAMHDRLHQPYRMEACPLLARLLPLVSDASVLGVALSGAGPSVLLIVDEAHAAAAERLVRGRAAEMEIEVVWTRIAQGAQVELL